MHLNPIFVCLWGCILFFPLKSLCVCTAIFSLTLSHCLAYLLPLTWVWGQRRSGRLFCAKGTEICLNPILTLPKTSQRPCNWSDGATEKLLPFSFLIKQKYLLSLIFLPEMQKWLNQEELKGTSVLLLCAMGKQVTTLFALHRNLCFLLYQCPLNAQHAIPAEAGFRVTHVSPNQPRLRESVCNLFFPPSWQEQAHSCSGRSHSDLTLPEQAARPMSWMANTHYPKFCGLPSQGKL